MMCVWIVVLLEMVETFLLCWRFIFKDFIFIDKP